MTAEILTRQSNKTGLSFKVQTFAALGAIVSAVILPQLFHIMGAVSGLGTALGETFLPMHLPILLAGLLAGPYAGAVSGLLAPVVSFFLTAMPGAHLLPVMMVELCAYGLLAGLTAKKNIPSFLKLLIAQVGGRIARAGAVLAAIYIFDNAVLTVSTIWMSSVIGIFGIVLQWALIPLIEYRIESIKANER